MPRRAVRAGTTLVTLGRLACDGDAADGTRLLGQPKRLGVLLYLMFSPRGGSLTREHVLSVFWPEASADRARNALRQAVSFVRGCVGHDAIASIGAHGLAAAPTLRCDALTFESLLDENRKEEALRLYRGEFLRGFHVTGAPAFGEWQDELRRHLANRAAKAAWDLSAECESAADGAGAAYWGKRALSLSPFSESEVQRLLRLLDRVGDVEGALRAFDGLKRALAAEFGVAPSAETAQLAASLRRRLEAASPALPPVAGTRRTASDRRVKSRRLAQAPFAGADRRLAADRRAGDRRSGRERRRSGAG